MSPVEIRAGRPADSGAIRQVHQRAFGSPVEADLVGELEADGDAVLSLVAALEGTTVGHVLFSRLAPLEARGLRVSALGPLGVVPDRQRRGIATALVRAGIASLRDMGEDLVFVLGDPGFYARFGFSAEAARAFQTPYDGPHQQAMALSDAGHAARGVVRYGRAFAKLS